MYMQTMSCPENKFCKIKKRKMTTPLNRNILHAEKNKFVFEIES